MLDDVELFLELNQEYAKKPLIPNPPKYDPQTLDNLGKRRAAVMDEAHNIRGKRVLEIGCGNGETARALAKELGCKVVGVDVEPAHQKVWATLGDCDVDFRLFDVSQEDASVLGKFDFIYSNATLEHVVHPFALLTSLVKLLPVGGRMHFNMGLHRGTMGSHLYRDVLFPWPHLVFTESTFERFYERIGKPKKRPVWINHITAAQWLEIFDSVGLHSTKVWYHVRPLDRPFYDRFDDILSRYPIYDLERDLMYVDLVKPDENPKHLLNLAEPGHPAGQTLRRRRFEAMQDELVRVERIALARYEELNALNKELERVERIATARLEELKAIEGKSNGNGSGVLPELTSQLEQKIARLSVIEERLNKDLRGVRKLGRAVNWTSSALRNFVQPQVSAILSAAAAATQKNGER